MERKVILIVGPTCSGKTKLSLSLAAKLKTEIISADSRQVYKHLNIGTAKPSIEEQKFVKHHFIDCLNPDEEFNVSKFEETSINIIEGLLNQGKIPIVVGGSGLYIKALVDGIFNTVDTDSEYRQQLKENIDKYGKEYLYNELKKVDPESASKMLPQNWKRVMRALEVYHLTRQPIWKHQQDYHRNLDFSFVQYGMYWEREILYKNIEKRVDMMIESGLVNEVRDVLNMGYSKELNSLNTVGYKEIIAYLNNEITLDRAIELIKRNTRRFAKRQMTWFRKDDRIKWITVAYDNEITDVSTSIM